MQQYLKEIYMQSETNALNNLIIQIFHLQSNNMSM